MVREPCRTNPETMSNQALKARMRERLERVRWTLEELADQTGESYSNIRNWVTGRTRVPATFLARFAAVVPVNAKWLLTGQGSPDPFEERTADLMFHLFSRIQWLEGQSGADRERLQARLMDMIVLLDEPEPG